MPPSTTEEPCRLISSPVLSVTPPVPKRPENGGENDRSGRERAYAGTQMSVMPEGVRACTGFFRSK